MKELLLLLAAYPYKPSTKEILRRSLNEVTDWNSFVRLVNAHGIIALATYNIKEAGLEGLVPVQAMAMLENGLRQSTVRNAWLTERWKEVNEILNGASIQHLLLKGMALEHTVYGARGLRQMTDNDIFIRREEGVRAWELLKKHGYEPLMAKSAIHNKILPGIHKHLPMLTKDGYSIEIHIKLPGEEYSDPDRYEGIFRNAETIRVNGIRAYVPPAGVHLDYLVRHHADHELSGDCQIRTYSDIKNLDAANSLTFPDEFVYEPKQAYKRKFRNSTYKRKVSAYPMYYRILFVAGDIFPSLEWMRRRYKCGTLAALARYPLRLGKVLWLI